MRSQLPSILRRAVPLLAACAVAGGAVLAAGHSARAGTAAPAATRTVIWSDEFSGSAGAGPDPRHWTAQVGGAGWGNHELEYYTARPRNAHLDGHGHLVISALRERYRNRRFTSARLITSHRFAFRYGTVAARIRIPRGIGFWPAFWMLGQDIDTVGYPDCGEIDVMEAVGQHPRAAWGSVHGPPDPTTGVSGRYLAAQRLAEGFHVYAAYWTPTSIAFTVDGHVYYTATPADLAAVGQRWVENRPFFLLLNLAVGGPWPGSPTPQTPFPGRMVVDWVRISR